MNSHMNSISFPNAQEPKLSGIPFLVEDNWSPARYKRKPHQLQTHTQTEYFTFFSCCLLPA